MAESTLGWPEPFEVWGFGGRGSDFIPGANVEAIGGCEQRSDLFAFCKIAPAVVRRVDLSGSKRGKGGTQCGRVWAEDVGLRL